MVSPWYATSYTSPLTVNFSERIQEYCVGTMFIFSSLPGLIAPLIKDDNRIRALKLGSFMLFLSWLFLFILRVFTVGWTPWHWMPMLIISLLMGVNRLFLEVKSE